jgi:lipoprotein-anchoring transpeptidase ErfK/SrfK
VTDAGGAAPQEARRALQAARQALLRGDRGEARRMARLAARLSPRWDAPWLILAAVSEPRAGLAYAARALEVNPGSQAARGAIRWLIKRLPREARAETIRELHIPEGLGVDLLSPSSLASPTRLAPGLLVVALLIAGALAVWLTSQPAAATQTEATPEPVAKATFTPTFTATSTASPTPTITVTPTPTLTPTPTPTPTPRPAVSWTYSTDPAELADEGRWIDVDLSEQRATAYEGTSAVNEFIVSTGVSAHPTVTGQFRIYVKLKSTAMAGPGYYLPGVPFTMYFYKGYSLHGTYWHHNFGVPMSHGCVNMFTPDAEWLFNWASVGTLVNVHP